jgi:broad specificity phosphatase PhoE
VNTGNVQKVSQVYLVRHGETAWSRTGRHTGRTDVPLTEEGEQHARQVGKRLQGVSFVTILSSPLIRARRTCELAGLGGEMTTDADLQEWDYGEYEGRTTADIQKMRPGWNIFSDGCPGGETLKQIELRADSIVLRLRRTDGNLAIFSHGHFLRVLAVRWLNLPAIEGRRLLLGAGALSILGYEHNSPDEPALALWNDRDL